MTRQPLPETSLAGIWSALPSPAFLTVDQDGQETILTCNPAAEQFLSASALQVSGNAVFDRLSIDALMAEAVTRARSNCAPIFVNDTGVRVGSKAPEICNLQIVPLNDERATLLLIVAPREIAERLGRKRSVKSDANSAIGMAEMLAHEIKNPLAGISGAAQLLSMGLSAADRELSDLIVEETKRIVKLLDQVEHFGDQRPPERRPINIHDTLERARQSASVGFGAHMCIKNEYDPSLPEALADPDQLLQVFLNLLKNASEAQPQGGTIWIRTYFERGLQVVGHDGRRVGLPLHIEISDDGPGLPPTIADSVFEPFVSGRENGTGLGLALVSKIVLAHEGWIDMNARVGRTVFRVSLPLAKPRSTTHRMISGNPKDRH